MEEKNFPEYVLILENLLNKIFKNIKDQNIKEASELKMSIPQFFCMLMLFHCEKVKMSDLAEILSLSYASATNLINRLVDSNLVIRYDQPEDRRVVMVNLTEKGREFVNSVRIKRLKKITENASSLSNQEIKTMIEGIEIFTRIMPTK